MQNHVTSSTEWARSLPSENAKSAEVRKAYARKRSGDQARERYRALTNVVQSDVIPRLMLLHPDFAYGKPKTALKPDAELVADFTNLVLGQDVSAVFDAFTGLISKGYTADCLFLDLLAPSAALLGRLWDEDLCDFIEVTAGVARLQLLLSTFRTDGRVKGEDDRRRVLIMGAPGEKHTFGVAIVEQFMRAAGWQVTSGLASSPGEIADLVKREWFAVVGLTLSCESRLDQLAVSIRSVRAASRNKAVGIMVGGPMFLEHPEFVGRVGADASAIDAPTAVLLAQRLLDFGETSAVQ